MFNINYFKKLFNKKTVEESEYVETETLYSYEWRKEIPEDERNTEAYPSRPFCVRLMELSKTRMWSDENILLLGQKLGYDVFERAGGWWDDHGTMRPHCRHEWVAHIVAKEKEKR